ncbi:MAG: hypothetical protein M5U05_16925 [Anaerolineales bacterium]|jgi:hypothetical protein|nr:hypothetical protein [Anaerolineales bacterium]
MISSRLQIWLCLAVLAGVSLIATACVSIPAQPINEGNNNANAQPVVLITQMVTQIVATPTITPAPPQISEVFEAPAPVASSGYDPFSVPIYYPIRGCFASRLHVGDVAFVANGAGTIGIHQTHDIGYAPIWRHLNPGELMDVIDGPWCDRGALTWKIATSDGLVGFVPEGDGNTYWLLPMAPSTEPVLSKDELKLRKFLRPGESLMVIQDGKNYCR